MKQQIIDLWKESFGDTDDFIRLWFERVYKEEQTFVIRQNGQIVSALQIIPYEMTYYGTTIPVGYICGVCTLPSERGKGFMNQLMQQAINEMSNLHYALAVLIPATPRLFDLYRRYDFANAFDYATEEIQSEEHLKKDLSHHNERSEATHHIELQRIVSCDNLDLKTIYAYYQTKQNERDLTLLHSANQFETICRDQLLGGCELWVASTNKQPAGLVFANPVSEQTLSIREIMFNNPETKNLLIQTILNHHQLYHAKLRIPPGQSNSLPYGMARIINQEQMIDLYRSFHTHTPNPDNYNNELSSLTQTLLNYDQRQAYMNLMLD